MASGDKTDEQALRADQLTEITIFVVIFQLCKNIPATRTQVSTRRHCLINKSFPKSAVLIGDQQRHVTSLQAPAHQLHAANSQYTYATASCRQYDSRQQVAVRVYKPSAVISMRAAAPCNLEASPSTSSPGARDGHRSARLATMVCA